MSCKAAYVDICHGLSSCDLLSCRERDVAALSASRCCEMGGGVLYLVTVKSWPSLAVLRSGLLWLPPFLPAGLEGQSIHDAWDVVAGALQADNCIPCSSHAAACQIHVLHPTT